MVLFHSFRKDAERKVDFSKSPLVVSSRSRYKPLFRGAPAACLWSSSVHGIGGPLCVTVALHWFMPVKGGSSMEKQIPKLKIIPALKLTVVLSLI